MPPSLPYRALQPQAAPPEVFALDAAKEPGLRFFFVPPTKQSDPRVQLNPRADMPRTLRVQPSTEMSLDQATWSTNNSIVHSGNNNCSGSDITSLPPPCPQPKIKASSAKSLKSLGSSPTSKSRERRTRVYLRGPQTQTLALGLLP